jgi:hypothetical protein
LIELALALPVLIAVVYYLHDIPKYKRMKSKLDFCAHCMVNVLQNISQKRENKKITWNDVKFAIAAGFSTIYPGKTMFATKSYTYVYGHCPMAFVVCVKGMANGKASVLWQVVFGQNNSSPNNTGAHVGLRNNHDLSTIKCLQNVSPSQIYNGLEIKENEIKILVECAILYGKGSQNFFTDGRACDKVFFREAMGFLILNPKSEDPGGSSYFTKVVIFAPKTGLFDETPPSGTPNSMNVTI